jgi:hypothetical protein
MTLLIWYLGLVAAGDVLAYLQNDQLMPERGISLLQAGSWI